MTWMLLGWMRFRWPISAAACAASPPHGSAALAARHPGERQRLAVVVMQPRDVDLQHPAAMRRSAGGARRRRRRAIIASRSALSVNICASSREDLQVLLGGLLGHEQHEHQAHRVAVGRVERHRLRRGARTRPARSFSPLMRPCGIATPWPRPVEPSFSRANRLSNTRLRAMPSMVLEQQPHLLEQALLARRLQVEHDVRRRTGVLATRLMRRLIYTRLS